MDQPGVPLSHYRDSHPGTAVQVFCLQCQDQRVFPITAVIAQLEARGAGGAQTGIRELAGLVREPCPRCGSLKFETRPAFPPVSSRAATP